MDDTKLRDAVHMLEGMYVIQRDLDRLEKQNTVNLMKYNKAKCKFLQTGLWQFPAAAQSEG